MRPKDVQGKLIIAVLRKNWIGGKSGYSVRGSAHTPYGFPDGRLSDGGALTANSSLYGPSARNVRQTDAVIRFAEQPLHPAPYCPEIQTPLRAAAPDI
jgi:hypothetical protein